LGVACWLLVGCIGLFGLWCGIGLLVGFWVWWVLCWGMVVGCVVVGVGCVVGFGCCCVCVGFVVVGVGLFGVFGCLCFLGVVSVLCGLVLCCGVFWVCCLWFGGIRGFPPSLFFFLKLPSKSDHLYSLAY